MKKWLRRIRGAVGMGLTWAAGWALVVVLMGVTTILLPGLEVIFEAADDELLIVMMLPAFLGGVVFSTVLGVAGRRRRFDELSLAQFAGWGAIGGLLLGLVPGIGATLEGTATIAQGMLVVVTVTLLSTVSAAGSLIVARSAEDRALLEASDDVADIGLSADEARELLGGSG